jgi:hypothetical protein
VGDLFHHPPKVRLILRIGVTGHRNQALEESEELKTAVLKVLETIKGIADQIALGTPFAFENKAECRVVSALAVGADRAVARAAKAAELPLDYILPFQRDIYTETFGGDLESIKDFYDLLADGKATILELDGGSSKRTEAFAELADALVANCDVLLAIWDGGAGEGAGGTRDVIERAIATDIPVVWFDTKCERPPIVLRSIDPASLSDDRGVELNLQDRLLRSFAFDPQPGQESTLFVRAARRIGRDDSEQGKATSFFRERSVKPVSARDLEEQWQGVWDELDRLEQETHKPIVEPFRRPFGWVDRLANRYGLLYKASTVFNLALGAVVVLTAFWGHFISNSQKHGLTVLELSLVSLILAVTMIGWFWRWHERWLDYRWLAEVLRQMHFVAPLAWVRPPFRAPAHLGSGHQGPRWLAVYFRCLLRQAPLPATQVEGSYLAYCQATLLAMAMNQIKYHRRRAKLLTRFDHWLHRFGFSCFFLALIGCVLHLADVKLEPWLGFMVVVLPAFASASSAILHYGEFRQQIGHSKALVSWLRETTKSWGPKAAIGRKALEDNAKALSEAMIDELADWRDAFVDKYIPGPH